MSRQELERCVMGHPGSIVFVQALPGFNVVELSEKGELQETTWQAMERFCRRHGCLLLSLAASDCVKVGFTQLAHLLDTSMPHGTAKEVLDTYRACSFGSFATSLSRGKVRVAPQDGSATDGLIRSVDATIGQSVERLRKFELQLYRDALRFCEDDPGKQAVLKRAIEMVQGAKSQTPGDYLTDRASGFGEEPVFTQLRDTCSAEITAAANAPNGVLTGCVTPMYDDWTVHQALRVLARLDPLPVSSAKSISEHLAFVADCMQYMYGMKDAPDEYAAEIFRKVTKSEHIVFHDVGSDTGPDDFPACAVLAAMAKFKSAAGGSPKLNLLAVGGEGSYRQMRSSALIRCLIPHADGVELGEAPYIAGISIKSPFVPVALVQTVARYCGQPLCEKLPN
uniref:Uncharacterized protein n=1 Tax=Tetraselmis sp. GSL018 TaxID=582737 RepID=A0A061RV57_9CHLO